MVCKHHVAAFASSLHLVNARWRVPKIIAIAALRMDISAMFRAAVVSTHVAKAWLALRWSRCISARFVTTREFIMLADQISHVCSVRSSLPEISLVTTCFTLRAAFVAEAAFCLHVSHPILSRRSKIHLKDLTIAACSMEAAHAASRQLLKVDTTRLFVILKSVLSMFICC